MVDLEFRGFSKAHKHTLPFDSLRTDKQFTVDAFLLAEDQTKDFLVDARLRPSNNFLVDAFLQEEQTKDFLIDARIAGTANFSVDAILRKTIGFTGFHKVHRHDIVAIIAAEQENTKNFTVDAYLLEEDITNVLLVEIFFQ